MRFGQSDNNLRDIHKFMTSVEQARSLSNELAINRGKKIVERHKRLTNVENSLDQFRCEIAAYKNKLIKSKDYMSAFNECKANFAAKLIDR